MLNKEEIEKTNKSNSRIGNEDNQQSNNNNSKKITIIVICILIVVLLGVFYYFNSIKEKERLAEEERIRIEQEEKDNEFKHTMAVTAREMTLNVGVGSKFIVTYIELYNKYAPTLGADYVKNVIQSTGSDEEFKTSMKEKDDVIKENMKWLAENKSETYNNVYEVLLEMYDNYRYFYDKSIDLAVYSSNLEEIKKKGNTVLEKVNRIIVIQPDMENVIKSKED